MKLVRFGDRRTGLVVDLEAMWGSAPRPVASPSQHGLKSAKDSTSGWMKLGVQVIARPTATESLHHKLAAYRTADALVREALTPAVSAARAEHTSLLETRAGVRQAIALVERISDLRSRRMDAESALGTSGRVTDERPGLPPASVQAFSAPVETLLDAWRFPHEKPVYFDERSQDLILGARRRGGKVRSSSVHPCGILNRTTAHLSGFAATGCGFRHAGFPARYLQGSGPGGGRFGLRRPP
jgi:hypothetical protein